MNRFRKHYENILCYDLLFKDHFINVMQLPKMSHITLNSGIGIKAVLDKKHILSLLLGLEYISNQRPIITRAKKSIDKFKLREKMAIGCKVTLRKNNLNKFMDRFINKVLPIIDNSHEIFNSVYLKKYLVKREELYSSNLALLNNQKKKLRERLGEQKEEIKENLPNAVTKIKNKQGHYSKNLAFGQSKEQPYLKWTGNVFSSCSLNLREKLWLLNNPKDVQGNYLKNVFLPQGKEYISLSLKESQKNFIENHFFFSNIYEKKKENQKNLHEKNKRDKRDYSIAFGLKDFISSTWLRNFGSNCGDIETSNGIDIIFVSSIIKNKNLSQPQYFLSNYQMPF